MNKEKELIKRRNYMKQYRHTHPWMKHFAYARFRCTSKSSDSYHKYGGRGIEFMLTRDEIEFIWNRDKASNLKRPSLDRIDPSLGYSLENCRFIELSENSRRGADYCVRLTEKDVLSIRSRFKPGMAPSLAREYGVDPSTISLAATVKTWKHILAPKDAPGGTR